MTVSCSDAARMVLSVAVAQGGRSREHLHVSQGGADRELVELRDDYGTRIHETTVEAGLVNIDYYVQVSGRASKPTVREIDAVTFLRQSRYCESDALASLAHDLFPSARGHALVRAVEDWTANNIEYQHGSTSIDDGALAVIAAGRGACRDFAHVVIALLRARDVPARYVSVYAPGLLPPDFHAVAEALVDGEWVCVDATALAPVSAMLRIATGRDAADAAFMTTIGGVVDIVDLEVSASLERPMSRPESSATKTIR